MCSALFLNHSANVQRLNVVTWMERNGAEGECSRMFRGSVCDSVPVGAWGLCVCSRWTCCVGFRWAAAHDIINGTTPGNGQQHATTTSMMTHRYSETIGWWDMRNEPIKASQAGPRQQNTESTLNPITWSTLMSSLPTFYESDITFRTRCFSPHVHWGFMPPAGKNGNWMHCKKIKTITVRYRYRQDMDLYNHFSWKERQRKPLKTLSKC